MLSISLLFYISLIFILFLTLSSYQAVDIDLNESQSMDDKTFQNIQDAIDNSKDSDTILLEGSYTSLGSKLTIDKSVTIKGKGKGTVLNGMSKSRILNIKSGHVSLENILFFLNAKFDLCVAIYQSKLKLLLMARFII